MSEEKFYPSEGELEILKVLWQHEPATVRFVHEQLSHHKDTGYTTTLKQMQRLLEKGMLSRAEKGKMHLYLTTLPEAEVRMSMLQKMVQNVFKGSAVDLAMEALGSSRPSAAEIHELEQLIQEMKKSTDDDAAH